MKTCSVDGCGKPLRARGVCSTHYNQQHQPNRHVKVTVPCAWCEQPCEKEPGRTDRYSRVFCSLVCRDAWRKANAISRRLPVPLGWSRYYCDVPAGHPARRPQLESRVWTAGWCAECGRAFVDRQGQARYCSSLCTKRAGRRRWKVKADRLVAPSVRRYVYRRDRWMCQACHTRVAWTKVVPHPRAPTIDHIIPQSEGGDHNPANLRTTHFKCNWERGNRGGDEQLALVG